LQHATCAKGQRPCHRCGDTAARPSQARASRKVPAPCRLQQPIPALFPSMPRFYLAPRSHARSLARIHLRLSPQCVARERNSSEQSRKKKGWIPKRDIGLARFQNGFPHDRSH
jgi:hypothetical protein